MGIVHRQYPQVIYPLVLPRNTSGMEETEHWRLRLVELKTALSLKQCEIADAIGKPDSYVSRLLYEPGKKGRKNLGWDTIRDIVKAYNLRVDWFDLPLGSMLPSKGAKKLIAGEPATDVAFYGQAAEPPAPAITWPFKQTSYKRLQALLEELGQKVGPEALRDLDSLLDVAVARWEVRAAELRKRTG